MRIIVIRIIIDRHKAQNKIFKYSLNLGLASTLVTLQVLRYLNQLTKVFQPR